MKKLVHSTTEKVDNTTPSRTTPNRKQVEELRYPLGQKNKSLTPKQKATMKKKKETSKETFYFSHDYNTRSDVKIKKLIGKHGYLGYGLFWALIEDLYQNENKMPLDYDLLAFDLRSSSNVVKSIINNFDLFKIDGAPLEAHRCKEDLTCEMKRV